jgi:hypothetical protein
MATENAAGVIVFPLAWIFGYWGVAAPLLVARLRHSRLFAMKRSLSSRPMSEPMLRSHATDLRSAVHARDPARRNWGHRTAIVAA